MATDWVGHFVQMALDIEAMGVMSIEPLPLKAPEVPKLGKEWFKEPPTKAWYDPEKAQITTSREYAYVMAKVGKPNQPS